VLVNTLKSNIYIYIYSIGVRAHETDVGSGVSNVIYISN
jgi:hypothetical protein